MTSTNHTSCLEILNLITIDSITGFLDFDINSKKLFKETDYFIEMLELYKKIPSSIHLTGTPIQKFIANTLYLEDVRPTEDEYLKHLDLLKLVLNEKIGYCVIALFMNSMRKYKALFSNESTKLDLDLLRIVSGNTYKMSYPIVYKFSTHPQIKKLYPQTISLIESNVVNTLKLDDDSLKCFYWILRILSLPNVSVADKNVIVSNLLNQLAGINTTSPTWFKHEIFTNNILHKLRPFLSLNEDLTYFLASIEVLQRAAEKPFDKGKCLQMIVTIPITENSYEDIMKCLSSSVNSNPIDTTAEQLGINSMHFNDHGIPQKTRIASFITETICMENPRNFTFDMTLPTKIASYQNQILGLFKSAQNNNWVEIFIPSAVMVEVCLRELCKKTNSITKNNSVNNHHFILFDEIYDIVKDKLNPLNKLLIDRYFISPSTNFRNNAAHGLYTDSELKPVLGFIAFFVLYSILKLEF